MRVTLLCSSAQHPVNKSLLEWAARNKNKHDIQLVRNKRDLQGGDILFLISCGEIITGQDKEKFRKTLVIHASDLPKGRGWNPHVWAIVDGATEITVSLLEAHEKVDRGDIWKKVKVNIPKSAVYHEINELLFEAETSLIDFALDHFLTVNPEPQDQDIEPNYYRLRTPMDSEINPNESIASQFNLIRVCDAERYPAFFKLYGYTYKLIIEKVDHE